MNPTDPAFPTGKESTDNWTGTGMDLRTYMATAFLAAQIAYDGISPIASNAFVADMAIQQADALIARLNAK